MKKLTLLAMLMCGCTKVNVDTEKHAFERWQPPVWNETYHTATQLRICTDCGLAEIRFAYTFEK